MNLQRFLDERRGVWAELDGLVHDARGRAERLGPQRVRRLGELYRGVAADLALARRRWPAEPSTAQLEDLVGRARHLVYAGGERRESLVGFFARGYWRLVAERPVPLAVAALLLLGPGALAAAWALTDPGAAAGLVPAVYRSVTEPRPGGDLGLGVEEQAEVSSVIFTNNIRVTFLAFAGGVLGGLGTAALIVYNGILLGGVAGLATSAGNGRVLLELVVAHGVLELSCIVVTAAAGLRLGWALVSPGRARRVDALVAEARRSVPIVLGTAPWLVVAGLVEGFVTPAGIGLGAAVAVGVALAALYWALVVARGAMAAP